MGDRSQSITIRSTMESDWPQIRGLRIENATDNPISYGATLHTTRRMNVDAWRLRGRRGEGPDTASLAAIDTKTGRWVGMMSGQLGDEDGPQAILTGVYVSSDYRGRQFGIADALLDEVEDWACRTSDRLRLFVYENSPRLSAGRWVIDTFGRPQGEGELNRSSTGRIAVCIGAAEHRQTQTSSCS